MRTRDMRQPVRVGLSVLMLCLWGGGGDLRAQAEPGVSGGADVGAEGNAPAEAPPLNLGQQAQQIHRDYERFEQKLLELGELLQPSDPDRAELLTRTRSQSRERRVLDRMRSIARLLEEGNQLGEAVGQQDELLLQIEELIKLLQSEDARDRNKKDIEWLEGLLKDTGKLIGEQKDARAATERGGDAGALQQGQQRVSDHARALADKIDRRDAERAAEQQQDAAPGADASPPEGEPQDAERPAGSPEGQPSENEPTESARSPDGQPADSQEPSDSSRSEQSSGRSGSGSQSKSPPGSQSKSQAQSPEGSQPQQQPGGRPQPLEGNQRSGDQPSQQPGDQQESESPTTPGRAELQQAIEEMQQAIEELKRQQRDAASDEQDAALAHLEQMKAKLEEILRQLREEEREMLLTLLEARFQEMLRVQLQINAETERLEKVAPENRESRHTAKATDLARDQKENALEADRALLLLKEEGSSVAFPEAVEQMRDSMMTVAGRLDRADTGETTQLIEQIIVETLDEMILALQKELEKLKEQQQQQPQQQQQQQQDPALVNALAELKMIRSLQNQINRLTRQIGLDIEGEQAADAENQKLLRDLARRQQRVQEATYDLQSGKSPLGQQLRKRSP